MGQAYQSAPFLLAWVIGSNVDEMAREVISFGVDEMARGDIGLEMNEMMR